MLPNTFCVYNAIKVPTNTRWELLQHSHQAYYILGPHCVAMRWGICSRGIGECLQCCCVAKSQFPRKPLMIFHWTVSYDTNIFRLFSYYNDVRHYQSIIIPKLLLIALENIQHHWTGHHCLGKVGSNSSYAVAVSAAARREAGTPVHTANGGTAK